MNEPYLIYADGKAALFTNQTAAMEEAEYVLQNRPEIKEVAVYQLIKVGKRRTAVEWNLQPSYEPEAKLKKPKANGINLLRPSARRDYQEWTTDENSYLVGAAKAGIPYEEIAKDLGRTKRAVEVQASRLRQE
jgi:hypothetical protein